MQATLLLLRCSSYHRHENAKRSMQHYIPDIATLLHAACRSCRRGIAGWHERMVSKEAYPSHVGLKVTIAGSLYASQAPSSLLRVGFGSRRSMSLRKSRRSSTTSAPNSAASLISVTAPSTVSAITLQNEEDVSRASRSRCDSFQTHRGRHMHVRRISREQ